MAEAATQEAAQKPFLIENVVRKQGTRLHRVRANVRHRFKQYVAGMRLTRGKKLPLNSEAFDKHKAQILQMLRDGIVAVHTPDNIRVTTLPDGRFVLTKMPNQGTKVLEKGEMPSCFGGTATAAAPPPAPKADPAPVPPPIPNEDKTQRMKVDDLTVLPNIGGGRVKKLAAAGVTSFVQIASMSVEDLVTVLGIDAGVAAEVIEAAKGR